MYKHFQNVSYVVRFLIEFAAKRNKRQKIENGLTTESSSENQNGIKVWYES